MRALFCTCTALAALAACSASSGPGMVPVDAGDPTDLAGMKVVDTGIVAGFGTVAVTWTVNGMPPEMGCAAAGAANVRLQVFFGRPEMVPCTQGRFEATRVTAAQLNIGADLLRADGSVIYAYNIEATVNANQVNNVNVPFEPPGNLRVRWTINGNPASTECAAVAGFDVRLEGRRLTTPTRAPSCRTGQYTFQGVQPGDYNVSGALTRLISATMLTRIGMASGSASVTSGQTADLDLEFSAEPPRDQ